MAGTINRNVAVQAGLSRKWDPISKITRAIDSSGRLPSKSMFLSLNTTTAKNIKKEYILKKVKKWNKK
jgi:hypothetical protein